MTGLWDAHLKPLMVYAAQDYLSWLIGDAVIDEEFPPHLDEEFPPHLLRQISADSFYGFHIGSRKYAMHLEFQSRRDPKMARRLWEYNVIASCKFPASNLLDCPLFEKRRRQYCVPLYCA